MPKASIDLARSVAERFEPSVTSSVPTRHTSHATRHTPHVTRHTSHTTRHNAPLFRSVEVLGGGNINDSFLVRCTSGALVLQRINSSVFPDVSRRSSAENPSLVFVAVCNCL
jgi:hypothetical protein